MIEIDFAQLDFPGRDFFLGGCRATGPTGLPRRGFSLVLPPSWTAVRPPVLQFFDHIRYNISNRKYVALPRQGRGGPGPGA